MGNKLSDQEKELARVTGLSKDEIKKRRKVFMKNNPSGEIERSLFRQRIRENGSTMFDDYDDDEIDHIFNFYDLDGSGKVDYFEFEMSLHLLTKKKSPDEFINVCIKLIDIDGNGHIEKEELLRPYKRLYNKIENIKDSLPTELQTPESVVDGLFKEVDVDNNGSLSAQELIDFMKNKPDRYNYYGLNLIFGNYSP